MEHSIIRDHIYKLLWYSALNLKKNVLHYIGYSFNRYLTKRVDYNQRVYFVMWGGCVSPCRYFIRIVHWKPPVSTQNGYLLLKVNTRVFHITFCIEILLPIWILFVVVKCQRNVSVFWQSFFAKPISIQIAEVCWPHRHVQSCGCTNSKIKLGDVGKFRYKYITGYTGLRTPPVISWLPGTIMQQLISVRVKYYLVSSCCNCVSYTWQNLYLKYSSHYPNLPWSLELSYCIKFTHSPLVYFLNKT